MGTMSVPENSNTNTFSVTKMLSINMGQAGGSNHGDLTLISGRLGVITGPRYRLYRFDHIQDWLIRQYTG